MDCEAKRLALDLTMWTLALVSMLALTAHRAMAADHGPLLAASARWRAECGGCHVAYPPRLLSAPAWHRVMAGLERHFGSDASLDAATAAEIGAFLEQYGATGRRARDPADTLRITETPWWRRKHRKVQSSTWQRPDVKSAANCAACHTLAAEGDFSERNVRVPR